jgi:hypothetical protein
VEEPNSKLIIKARREARDAMMRNSSGWLKRCYYLALANRSEALLFFTNLACESKSAYMNI